MKKIVVVLLVLIAALYCAVRETSGNTIVVYSALEQYRNDDLKEHLDQRFPEYNIQIMYMPTAKIAAKVKSEGPRTDADILLGVETGYLEMVTDSLVPVQHLSTLEYLEGMNPAHGRYLIWESYGGGLAVNTEILAKHGLAEPRTYEDLLKPEYHNLITTQDPKSSSTGYNFYLNRRNELGLEQALEYYDQLDKNVKQYYESSSGPVKMLLQGECAIATALTYQVVTEINNGNPLKLIYPPQGSPYSLDGVGLVVGREKDPKNVEVFRYIVNEFLLYDKAHYNPGRILKVQPQKLKNYPQNIHYADMTDIDNLEVKKELLQRWKY